MTAPVFDWGLGRYEKTATELRPAAAFVVDLAAIRPGERVLDIATGTGNAALLAAAAGARTSGLDGAGRLIEVAQGRASAAGLDVDFRVGDFHALPYADGEFACVFAVFGLIFAADPQRALDEVLRVLASGGRALIAVWRPSGPVHSAMGGLRAAAARATGGSTAPPFGWSDDEAVGQLLHPDVRVRWHEAELPITAASPEDFLDGGPHPLMVAITPVLAAAGTLDSARSAALSILREANEDPGAFRVTSPYRVLELTIAA
jgi:SAM-dependent methyltransferase